MLYVPIDNFNNVCVEKLNTDIIRVYDSVNINQENNYTDYNTSNHYNSYTSSIVLTSQPTCINSDELTNDIYYRNDLSHILVIFFIMAFIIFYIPYKLIMRFYRKGR